MKNQTKSEHFRTKEIMKIVVDLRESASKTDVDNLVTLSESESSHQSYSIRTVEDSPGQDGQDRDTHEEKISLLVPTHACYPVPSQTPIYDFEMLAAGKELGSEEKILMKPPPRRCFGRQKRLLENYISAAEELQQDIERAWSLILDEDLSGAIQYGRFVDGRKTQGEETNESQETVLNKAQE